MTRTMTAAALTLSLALAEPALAQGYEPVTDEATFLSLVDGKTLNIALYGLTLEVTPDGQIGGSALGSPVTGTWSWQDGYFCREMAWGEDPIEYNCQLVELSGDLLRFTTDQGSGESASFRIR